MLQWTVHTLHWTVGELTLDSGDVSLDSGRVTIMDIGHLSYDSGQWACLADFLEFKQLLLILYHCIPNVKCCVVLVTLCR